MARIAAIRFEGNAAVADATLQAAMAKVAIGQEYSERDFRRLWITTSVPFTTNWVA